MGSKYNQIKNECLRVIILPLRIASQENLTLGREDAS